MTSSDSARDFARAHVVQVRNLEIIYPDQVTMRAQVPRYNRLVSTFETLYGTPPTLVARAPGRVNLIGEHIDYCGMPVFPMAIGRDCIIAMATLSDQHQPPSPQETTPTPTSALPSTVTVRVHHMQPDKFPACEFTHAVGHGAQVPIDISQLVWSNYFKCGYRGVLRLLASRSLSTSLPDGCSTLCCLVDGDIPIGAGLSSSSAFVSCTAITTLMAYGHDKEVDQRSITQVAIRSERDIGVNSGGMDQTCSIMAQPQSALFIEFQPHLDAIPVPVPRVVPALTFVIANSLVTSSKFVTAPTCYNLRVVETRLGAMVLARRLGILSRPALRNSPQPIDFKAVMDEYFVALSEPESDAVTWDSLCKIPDTAEGTDDTEFYAPVYINRWRARLSRMLDMVYTLLASPRRKSSPDEDTMRSGSPPPLDTVTAANDPGFTPEELADALDLPWSIVHDAVEMDKYPIRTDVYRLWARAIHVFSEARRVVKFRALCEQFNRTRIPEPTSTSVVELYQQLGDLMNSSQVSCRDRFQCSCSELDQLVKICREAGAIGSRLTGAGWGGCTVSLVPADQVDHFMARVKMNYYQARFPELVSQDQLGNVLFATQPGRGAAVYRLC